jgi:lysophospholipase L1-like esterase
MSKGEVRDVVWNLSKHSAGLMIRFRSNSDKIIVRYTVVGKLERNHIPSTGASGVDLYAIDADGNWKWCRGGMNFSDTITYRFEGIVPNDKYHQMGREYRLYFPYFNQVEWMEIGVEEGSLFNPLPLRLEKPIVVYGTSIAHGACATRPGMSWTNILGRKMDRPLINLAFSGNGRLEKEIIEIISEIDAKVYILDCLPNLTNADNYDDVEIKNRILNAVRYLKKKHPFTPIVLADHAGYPDGALNTTRKQAYLRVNKLQKEAYSELQSEEFKRIYYLTMQEINLGIDDMVDGTHPNDLGMMKYAESYEKTLRSILNEEVGMVSTTQPCTQYREPGNYDWEKRHRTILEIVKTDPPKMVILANSIIHFWGGSPKAKIVRENETWDNVLTPAGIKNFAFGWDRIENVLWRVHHGELEGYQADKILVMIGTNNLHLNSDREIIKGLHYLTKAIKVRQPESKVILMGLLPRRDLENRILELNLLISKLAGEEDIGYGDIGFVLLNNQKKIDESLFSDGLHPNREGYKNLSEALTSFLKN